MTENFNTLASSGTTNTTTPVGWGFSESGTNANTSYTAGTGSSNAGDTYSFGASSNPERALGALRSSTLSPILGASFTNNTGNTITSVEISYTGEQWRAGVLNRGAADRLDFQISTDATSLTAGTYTDVDALDFSSPNISTAVGALDGNLASNRTAISSTIGGLSIPNGATFFIRWMDFDIPSSDDGLAIDDFSLTAQGSGTPTPTPSTTPTPTPSPSPSPSPSPATNVIINELDSDTPGTDAAEFVELYDGGVGNTPLNGLVVVFFNGSNDLSYSALDLDGFTTNSSGYFVLGNAAVSGVDLVFSGNLLQNGADAVALYAGDATNFPTNTAITTTNLIDAVVYDTADPDDIGLLVLLNAGEPQVDENGGGDGPGHSIQRCPNGSGGARNTSTYLARLPSPDGANNCPSPPIALAIHQIQGDGLTSPYVGQQVITTGIVTALKSNGFFLQTSDSSVDLNSNTSEGIFVFTSVAPAVAVGDSVTVTATVAEFFNLTELSSPTVVVNSSGNPLPAPINLTTSILNPTGTVFQLERLEGMRLHANSLTAVSPTNEFGEVFTVLTGVARPFREPGVEASFTLPAGSPCCVPRFDENPERLMVHTAGQAGSTAIAITSGVTLTNVTGPLDFTFENYKLLPDTPPTTSANSSAVPVRTPNSDEFTVASFNLERFFTTDLTTPRLNKVSLAIREIMRSPDIIGVQEVGELSTLQAIADRVNTDTVAGGGANPGYVAYLEEGNDVGGIDVGFLVKSSTVTVTNVTQVGKTATFIDPNDSSVQLLNDRPPLFLRATVQPPNGAPFSVTVIVNHLRSLIDIGDTGPTGNRVRTKRRAQAEFIANEIQLIQSTENVISVGDYNAFHVNDGYVDVIGTIRGVPTALNEVVLASSDLVTPDLSNLIESAPVAQQYSFIFQGNAQAIDHVLVDPELLARTSGFAYARNNADFPEAYRSDMSRPERVSDHDMPVAYFSSPKSDTVTTVSNATAVFSSANQSVQLTAQVTADSLTVNEGTVTFTVKNASNVVVGSSTVGNVSSGIATATFILPGGTLPQALTITGVFSGGDFTHPSTGAGTLSVTYNICLLYDPTRAVKSGATYPIKIQLCDNVGGNVSSEGTTVHAIGVGLVSSTVYGEVMDAGNANPDNNFRYDSSLGGTGGYIFNLKTKGLSTGTYNLYFTAGNDPTVHTVQFQVK